MDRGTAVGQATAVSVLMDGVLYHVYDSMTIDQLKRKLTSIRLVRINLFLAGIVVFLYSWWLSGWHSISPFAALVTAFLSWILAICMMGNWDEKWSRRLKAAQYRKKSNAHKLSVQSHFTNKIYEEKN
jgi:hypothetical protein